jgi:hypothetical protein
MEVPVDGDTCPLRHLLRPYSQIVRPGTGADLNEDVSMVSKMNEMFPFIGTDNVTLWLRSRTAVSNGSNDAGSARGLQEGATAVSCIHRPDILPSVCFVPPTNNNWIRNDRPAEREKIVGDGSSSCW